MKKEKGLTLTGMVLASIVGVILLLLAFKIVPVYTEYYAIERNLKAMAMNTAKMTRAQRPRRDLAFESMAALTAQM